MVSELAVIVEVPEDIPVTRPEVLIVATSVSLLFQNTPVVRFLVLPSGGHLLRFSLLYILPRRAHGDRRKNWIDEESAAAGGQGQQKEGDQRGEDSGLTVLDVHRQKIRDDRNCSRRLAAYGCQLMAEASPL